MYFNNPGKTLQFQIIAAANTIWPALYLAERLAAWWAISAGLLIEYLVVKKVYNIPTKEAIFADVAANAVSAIVGGIIILIFSIIWEFGVEVPIGYFFDIWTWKFTWILVTIAAAFINAALEILVLRRFGVDLSKKNYLILVAANAITVGIAIISLFVVPEKHGWYGVDVQLW